ncbi:hypothetical protein GOODEAATRI_022583, partial [Goodea atripinnis]
SRSESELSADQKEATVLTINTNTACLIGTRGDRRIPHTVAYRGQLINEGVDPNHRHRLGWTALMVAAMNRQHRGLGVALGRSLGGVKGPDRKLTPVCMPLTWWCGSGSVWKVLPGFTLTF